MQVKFFDFPALPDSVYATYNPDQAELIRKFPGRVVTRNNQPQITSDGCFYQANQDIIDWVRVHISADIDKIGMRYQYGSAEMNCHGPHCDATRDYALLHVIDPAQGYLQFWSVPDHNLDNSRGQLFDNYDQLTAENRVDTPRGCWYLVDGRYPHSVEDLFGTRITLQINLNSTKGLL